MIDLNAITVSGRFTSDGEMVKSSTNGKSYLIIDLAMSDIDNSKDKSLPLAERKKTMYMHCLAFGKTGEYIFSKKLKGKRVVLKGKIDIQKRVKKSLNFQFENTHLIIEDYMVFSMGKKSEKPTPAPEAPDEEEVIASSF